MKQKQQPQEKKPPLYVASCSFGKDSIATILLALKHNEPLDKVVFSEVMFDKHRGISGENPDHIEWVYSTAIPKLESMGVRVDVVRAEKDFKDIFFHVCTKGKRIGQMMGFPMQGRCKVNSELKIKPIKTYLKNLAKEYGLAQYIGIALDEPTRLERMHQYADRVSLLEMYQYTEDMAYELCKENDLLSPIYQSVTRGGCWFCPNAKIKEFLCFRQRHPSLWDELREMSKTPNIIRTSLKFNQSFAQVEVKMDKLENEMKAQGKLFYNPFSNTLQNPA